MPGKRGAHSPEFKARVALEALSGRRSLAQLSSEYGVHPSQITAWTEELSARAPTLFAGDRQRLTGQSLEKAKASLQEQIERLQVEVDFLRKKSEPFR
jgi:transposase-like protein